MYLTVAEAAKAIGKSRSAISRAIRAKKLFAKKDEKGQWQIKPEDLLRVFPEASLENGPEHLLPEAPLPDDASLQESPLETLEQEIQWLREQLHQQTKQEQENHREVVHLLNQEAEERLRLTETLAAPLEQEIQQLRQELDQSKEKIRELRRLLALEIEERQRLQSSVSPPENQKLWSRWFK